MEQKQKSNNSDPSLSSIKFPLLTKIIKWILGGGSSLGLLTIVVVMVKDVAIDTMEQVSDNQTRIIEMQQEINSLRKEDEHLWRTISPTVQNYDKIDAQVGILMDMYKQQHGVRPVVVLMNPDTGVKSSFQPPAPTPLLPKKKPLEHLDDIEKAKIRKSPEDFREERMKIQQMHSNEPPPAKK